MNNENNEAFDVSLYPDGYEKVKERLLCSELSEEEKENFMSALIGFLVKG